MIDIQVGGLIGLIILIFDIYAIVKTVQSSSSTGAKVLWTVVILVFPLLGLLLWLLLGPKGGRPILA
jgi:Phospholipase_D-nuclease N-terminal